MHIKANTDYKITGFLYDGIVSSWTSLVYMFLIISGFGMCCGYYGKIADGSIDLEQFYLKRFKKTLPFFACLVVIGVAVDHTFASLFEGLMEATLAFGLLPNNGLSVLGVSWTLGVVFLFYMLFPYFVFLLRNKKRAWIVLGISLAINQMCSAYFFTEKFVTESFTPRHSFLFCTPFFIAGGILYLYKEEIIQVIGRHRWPALAVCVILTVGWYTIPNTLGALSLSEIKSLICYSCWLMYAISVQSRVMSNRFMKFFGSISMEMYLAHMVVFRVIQKLGLLYRFGDGWGSYLFVCILDIVLLTGGIMAYKKGEALLLHKSGGYHAV